MNEQELARIRKLPDYISGNQLRVEFKQLINTAKYVQGKKRKLNLLEAYSELSDRQWHTYHKLDLDLLRVIDSNLITLWDRDSLESTELVTSIVGALGLQNTYETIKKSLVAKLPQDVEQEILETIKEFGDDITNPYINK